MASTGNQSSKFEDLAQRYGRLIHSVVGRVAGARAHDLGDDIAQHILIALWKVTSREQEISHPSSYIYRTAVREAVRIVRKEQRKTETDVASTEYSALVRTPEELAESKQLGLHIKESLQDIAGDRQRATKAHLAGFTVEEMMEMFDWPYNRARNLIARGMADLRKGLQSRGVTRGPHG